MGPGRRLVYTWLFDHVRSRRAAVARYGGGQLTPVGRGTRVRLRHYGFVNEGLRDRHADGGAHYLPRLGVAAAGGEPGTGPGARGTTGVDRDVMARGGGIVGSLSPAPHR